MLYIFIIPFEIKRWFDQKLFKMHSTGVTKKYQYNFFSLIYYKTLKKCIFFFSYFLSIFYYKTFNEHFNLADLE